MQRVWQASALVLATALVTVLVNDALGEPARTSNSGGAVAAVKVVRETTGQGNTNPTAWTAVPGATTSITIPAGAKAIILARFTAESHCQGGSSIDWCSVRVLIDGTEANPASGNDFAFQTPGTGFAALALDRSSGKLSAGPSGKTVSVTVQQKVTSASTYAWLDDWHLTVERITTG